MPSKITSEKQGKYFPHGAGLNPDVRQNGCRQIFKSAVLFWRQTFLACGRNSQGSRPEALAMLRGP
ncbi:uncharacterized protein Dvar_00150 [Desulfosarcina variabilis str. Montpellier]